MTRKLGNYEIIERIGQGAFGVVYRARQVTMQREVALKRLPSQIAANREFVEFFLREAQLAAQLNHANIVTVIDFGEEEGQHFFSMEYVDGTDLRRLLAAEGPIEPRRALDFLVAMAEALAYAHDKGVIHHDVKPSNMMLRVDGRLLLGDFGIAQPLAEEDTAIEEAVDEEEDPGERKVMGTPNYMAPEICRGRAGDARSDLYGLGASFFHLLSGETMYTGDERAICRKQISAPVPSLKARCPTCPQRFALVIERLLAKDPAERYQSAVDLLRDLRPLQRDWPRLVRAPSSRRRATGGMGTGPVNPAADVRLVVRIVVGGAIALVLIIFGIWLFRATRERPVPPVKDRPPVPPPAIDDPVAREVANLRRQLATLEDFVAINPDRHPEAAERFAALLDRAVGTAVEPEVVAARDRHRRRWESAANDALAAARREVDRLLRVPDHAAALVAFDSLDADLMAPAAERWQQEREANAARVHAAVRAQVAQVAELIEAGRYAEARERAGRLRLARTGPFAEAARELAGAIDGIAAHRAAAAAARRRNFDLHVGRYLNELGRGRWARAREYLDLRRQHERELGAADDPTVRGMTAALGLADELAKVAETRDARRAAHREKEVTVKLKDGGTKRGILREVDDAGIVLAVPITDRRFPEKVIGHAKHQLRTADLSPADRERFGLDLDLTGLSPLARSAWHLHRAQVARDTERRDELVKEITERLWRTGAQEPR